VILLYTRHNFILTPAILDVINYLKEAGVEVVIYEPTITESLFNGCKVISNFDSFKEISDIILTNRFYEELEDVKEKVYTRDIFKRD